MDYKRSRIKQYYKEDRALRTETVIINTYDFGIGRRLGNLEHLQKIGFAANRRLLRVQTLSHDTLLGSEAFQHPKDPRAARISPTFTQPHGKVGLTVQGFEKPLPEGRLRRTRIIDRSVTDRCMRLSGIRASVIVQRTVKDA